MAKKASVKPAAKQPKKAARLKDLGTGSEKNDVAAAVKGGAFDAFNRRK